MSTRARGFTLVELLVAITVISMLMGILLPVFARVREVGRRTKCAHNLSQLGHAVDLYAEDYRGWLPHVHLTGSPQATNAVAFESADPDDPIKEVGIGLMWEGYVTRQTDGSANVQDVKHIQEVVTCPSTNFWNQTLYPDGQKHDGEYCCSYLYRGGGVTAYGITLRTKDDLGRVMDEFGKIVLATDANHEWGDPVTGPHRGNHRGKINISVLSDLSVTRKDWPACGPPGPDKLDDFLKDLDQP